jgi:cellulose synthase/poly-beta-1,6-N-acetylglucosamine synthase-like glycosyltransferase
MRQALEVFGFVVVGYFTLLNGIYLAFTLYASSAITRRLRQERHDLSDEAFGSPLSPPISVILPAHNEEAVIVASVRSLLRLRYPSVEIVVVNDGSTDRTMHKLVEEFELVEVVLALRDVIETEPIIGTYVSRRYPEIIVIDKEGGGSKASALNAGANAASYEFLCAADADAVLEDSALLRVARPILDDPEIVAATGGIVRIVNGCTIRGGEVVDVGLPQSRLAVLQVIEYFRAFLVGRVAWSRMRALLIVSGAFGLFRREFVEAVGGWSRETIGEDVELVVRMHEYLRRRGEPYRIDFVPDPVCWTEAPEDLSSLSSQRRRWQRGLVETLWTHRRMIGNPRFGAVGVIGMPYFVLFEALGPLIEMLGYILLPVAYLLGALDAGVFFAFLALAVGLGIFLSFAALALEEFSFRRHRSGRDLARMMLYALLENLGYRQLTTYWRLRAMGEIATRRQASWRALPRRGFDKPA